MQINKKLSQEIYDDAGYERVVRAKRYINMGKVNISKVIYDDPNNFELTAKVDGNYDNYIVKIRVQKGELEETSCECADYYKRYGACKHIVAALMKFEQTKYWDSNEQEKRNESKVFDAKYLNFQKIVTALYNEELKEINAEELEELPLEKKIKLEPKIIFDRFDRKLKLELKIGNNRMYKVKDLTEFYTRMTTKDFYKYGEKLEFLHIRENFTEDSQELLDLVLKYAEMLKYAENDKYSYYGSTLNHSSITLGENMLDEIFDVLKGKKVTIDRERQSDKLEFIEENPDIDEIIRRYHTDKEDFYDLDFDYIELTNEKPGDIDVCVRTIMDNLTTTNCI